MKVLPPEIERVDVRAFSAIRSLAPRLAGTIRQSEEAAMGMKVGYARVSTTGQKLDVQMDRARRAMAVNRQASTPINQLSKVSSCKFLWGFSGSVRLILEISDI